MLTQNQVQDSRTEQFVKHHTWRKRQTSHTRYTIKKETSVTLKKKDRQNQSTTTSTQTQTTCMREESHPKDKNKKEKPHDTFPPHQPQHPATWHPDPQSNPQRHTLNLPLTPTHTPCLHPCYDPFLHPTRILPTRLPTLSYTPTPTLLPPIVTVPPPMSTSLPQLYPCLSRSRYRSPSTCVPLPDGRYAMPPPGYHCSPVPSTQPLLSAYCSHVCLHYCAHPAIIMPPLWVQPLCSPFSIVLTLYVSPRSPALPPVPYASPLSLPAGSTTLTAR